MSTHRYSSIPVALLLSGCMPHYYEVGLLHSQGELVHRGGSLDEDVQGVMFTVGWSPQAETHHRETLMEIARSGGHSEPLVIAPAAPEPEGDPRTPDPVETLGRGAQAALWTAAAGLLTAIGFWVRKRATNGDVE